MTGSHRRRFRIFGLFHSPEQLIRIFRSKAQRLELLGHTALRRGESMTSHRLIGYVQRSCCRPEGWKCEMIPTCSEA